MVGADQLGFRIGELSKLLIETIVGICYIEAPVVCYNSINFYEGSA
jgi:hypothetical protein